MYKYILFSIWLLLFFSLVLFCTLHGCESDGHLGIFCRICVHHAYLECQCNPCFNKPKYAVVALLGFGMQHIHKNTELTGTRHKAIIFSCSGDKYW